MAGTAIAICFMPGGKEAMRKREKQPAEKRVSGTKKGKGKKKKFEP
jgi:hypothetical protein